MKLCAKEKSGPKRKADRERERRLYNEDINP